MKSYEILQKKRPLCLNSTILGHRLYLVLQYSPIQVREAELQYQTQPLDKSCAVSTNKQKLLPVLNMQLNSKYCSNVKSQVLHKITFTDTFGIIIFIMLHSCSHLKGWLQSIVPSRDTPASARSFSCKFSKFTLIREYNLSRIHMKHYVINEQYRLFWDLAVKINHLFPPPRTQEVTVTVDVRITLLILPGVYLRCHFRRA